VSTVKKCRTRTRSSLSSRNGFPFEILASGKESSVWEFSSRAILSELQHVDQFCTDFHFYWYYPKFVTTGSAIEQNLHSVPPRGILAGLLKAIDNFFNCLAFTGIPETSFFGLVRAAKKKPGNLHKGGSVL
jgi:hypothetical protein